MRLSTGKKKKTSACGGLILLPFGKKKGDIIMENEIAEHPDIINIREFLDVTVKNKQMADEIDGYTEVHNFAQVAQNRLVLKRTKSEIRVKKVTLTQIAELLLDNKEDRGVKFFYFRGGYVPCAAVIKIYFGAPVLIVGNWNVGCTELYNLPSSYKRFYKMSRINPLVAALQCYSNVYMGASETVFFDEDQCFTDLS